MARCLKTGKEAAQRSLPNLLTTYAHTLYTNEVCRKCVSLPLSGIRVSLFFLSPMDTSCAAGASWKLCLACSREGVLTQFSPVREGSGNVMQSGYVIALWVLESDVRGKRKLANSQTKRAKVRGRLAETQTGLMTFPYFFFFPCSFLKSIFASFKWLTGTGRCFLWHICWWAVSHPNGAIVVILWLKIRAFFKMDHPRRRLGNDEMRYCKWMELKEMDGQTNLLNTLTAFPHL